MTFSHDQQASLELGRTHKYQCPIIPLSPEGDRCGAAGLRSGYVQVTVTYVDSSSHHLSAQGACLKRACLGPKFRVSRWRVAELWRGRSSNELEYCLLGGRSLWVGHQIKGAPTLLLKALVQACNRTEQRADTLTLKNRTFSNCPDIYIWVEGLLLHSN